MRLTPGFKAGLRTFSGIQPTGGLHLGNYFGAVQQWTRSLSKNDTTSNIYCIVDMHAITLPQDPKTLHSNILGMAASLIGCGLDPSKCILFQQSMVGQHAELQWILGCVTNVPALSRLSQYKDKSEKLTEVPLGLFVYPVLQAADILLYKATRVPVGEDNLQNLEVTRSIARSFNQRFKSKVFPVPEAVLGQESTRVKSLRNPAVKMSKSDLDKRACVFVTDAPDVIVDKVKKAVTDFNSQVTYEPQERPGVANLIGIHSCITGQTPEEICDAHKGRDTGQYKLVVAEALVEHLRPKREKIMYLLNNKQHLQQVLQTGAEAAAEVAEKTMSEVRRVVGFT